MMDGQFGELIKIMLRTAVFCLGIISTEAISSSWKCWQRKEDRGKGLLFVGAGLFRANEGLGFDAI